MRNKKIGWLPLLAIALVVVGCAGSEYEQAEMAKSAGSLGADAGGMDLANESSPPGTQPLNSSEMSTASMQESQRHVIRNGEIGLRVDDVEKAEKQIIAMVTKGGGYVANTTSNDLRGANPSIDLTIRVPSTGFEDALTTLSSLGYVLTKTTSTDDVTAEIVDLGARIKTLTAKEDTFREMLRSSRNLNDVMSLQDRLTEVRTEIERMEAQRKSLSELASLSTIKVHLTREATVPQTVADTDPNWFGQTLGSATTSFMGVARSIVGVLTWLVVFSPFWLAPILFVVWVVRRFGRRVLSPEA